MLALLLAFSLLLSSSPPPPPSASQMGNGDTVKNQIASAIAKKVIEKFEQRKAEATSGKKPGPPFRVVILIPQLPEGDFMHDAGVRAIMYFQSKTIRTLLKEIETKTGVSAPGELILFASLRNKGDICGTTHTNQCYIHSKMLIVDDSIAIIGSANVNDRSMCGDRDSEICVVVRHTPRSDIKSPILQFRMRLWNRYCGLASDGTSDIVFEPDPQSEVATGKEKRKLFGLAGLFGRSHKSNDCDSVPVPEATFADEFVRTCMSNTDIYERASCFCMPSNKITNMRDYARLSQEANAARDGSPIRAKAQLNGIVGLLVMFPVHFLKDDTTLTPRFVLLFISSPLQCDRAFQFVARGAAGSCQEFSFYVTIVLNHSRSCKKSV